MKTSVFLSCAFFAVGLSFSCQNKIAGNKKKELQQLAPVYTPFGSTGGSSALSLSATTNTFLKARIADSGALSESEKCAIAPGSTLYLTASAQPAEQDHFKIALATSPAGCSLQSGFIYKAHFTGNGFAQEIKVSGLDECGIPAEVDTAKANQLAQTAQKNQRGGLSGKCYAAVADSLEELNLTPVGAGAWSDAGIATISAADFITIEKSKVANNFIRVRPKGWGCVPKGAIVTWKRGGCGFNATHGHIEIVVSANKSNPGSSNLCSDGCQGINTGCSLENDATIYMPRKK